MNAPSTNGVDGANAQDALPPWLRISADALIPQLQQQIASQATEIAAMRAYIDQLHQALQTAAAVEQKANT
jgi:hypothetical protein